MTSSRDVVASNGDHVSGFDVLRSCGGVDEMLRVSARRHGPRPAVIDGERSITHTELDALVDELAGRLLRLGTAPGDHGAYLMDHRAECVVAFFALQRAGQVMVPVNAKLTEPEIDRQLRFADVRIVVTSPSMLVRLRAAATDNPLLRHIVVIPSPADSLDDPPDRFGSAQVHYWELTGSAAEPVEDTRSPDEAVALWYTSGTTGVPKGVLHTKRSGVEAVTSWVEASAFTESDSGPSLNLYHIGSMSSAIPLIVVGGAIVLVRWVNMDNTLDLVHRHRITYMTMQPVILNLLDRDPTVFERYDVSSVRRIVVGSGPSDPALRRRMMGRFPNATWAEGWGQTETNSGGTCTRSPALEHFGSIGLPIRCIEQLVVLNERGEEMPDGVVGEVCVRGPSVMLGYYRNPAGTAEATKGGWLHTGDLGYRAPDGYVFLKGRRHELIIRGGENVYPGEVEAALCEHPAVAEAAVVGVPDSVMSEAPVGFVVLRNDSQCDSDELRAFAAERLARYKVPTVILVVDELPRTAIGKVAKPLLVEQAKAHAR
jgi:acyl-CoA synthetase (AMP-forming)/AMP-acid ligase II